MDAIEEVTEEEVTEESSDEEQMTRYGYEIR